MSEIKNTVRFVLDVVKERHYRKATDITLTQGEQGSTIVMADIQMNGKPCDLTDCAVDFAFVRFDGKGDSEPATITAPSAGTVTYTLPSSVAAVSGACELAYFKITDSAKNVSMTEPIGIYVRRGADISCGQADDYISRYEELLEKFNLIIDAANKQKTEQQAAWKTQTEKQQTDWKTQTDKQKSDFTKAETERATAESVRVTAEQGRTKAETSRVSQEAARVSAENARISAEQERSKAEGARTSAENARVGAEKERVSQETARNSSEATRKANETARQTAETGRVKAEDSREVAEASRVTEFEQIKQNAQKIRTVLLTAGQYDESTRVPTISGEHGVTYYVPSLHPAIGDAYAEWQYLLLSDGTSSWEKMGSSDAVPDAITTTDIDAVISDSSPSGSRYMALSSLKYWWAKVKVYFAPKSHASSSATTYGAASASLYGHTKASQTIPKTAGTAALGDETASFSRGDHVHPAQTSVSGSSGSCTGNAASATRLQTARTLSVSGDATGSVSFNGSANAAIPLTIGKGRVTSDKLDRVYASLNIKTQIGQKADLNTYKTAGTYTCPADATAATILNSPTGGKAFSLVVDLVLGGATYLRQIVEPCNATLCYVRVSANSGSTWGAWIQTALGTGTVGTDQIARHAAIDRLGRGTDTYATAGLGDDGMYRLEYTRSGQGVFRATEVDKGGTFAGVNLGCGGMQFLASVVTGGRFTLITPPHNGYLTESEPPGPFMNITDDHITILLNDTHYMQISNTNWFFRDGAKGFGWWHGAFSPNLVFNLKDPELYPEPKCAGESEESRAIRAIVDVLDELPYESDAFKKALSRLKAVMSSKN